MSVPRTTKRGLRKKRQCLSSQDQAIEGVKKNTQIGEHMVQGYMMRAYVRLSDLVCRLHPRVVDQLHPCKLHNRLTGHLPYPVVAGDNHTLVNQRAADMENAIRQMQLSQSGIGLY